jgi:hypothetical protein
MLNTISEFQTKFDAVRAMYTQRNINMTAWRNLYFMDPKAVFVNNKGEYMEPEPDEKRIVLPIAQNIVESYRELLLAKSPAISVPQKSVEGESLLTAEHNEKALLAIWSMAWVNDRLADSMWHALVDGWGVLQTIWDKNDQNDCPIRVLHHDPYNVYPMPDEYHTGWKYVIHAFPRLVGSIRSEWPKDDDEESKQYKTAKKALDELELEGMLDTDEIMYFDYWDGEVNAIGCSYTKVTSKRSKTTTTITKWLKEPAKHGYGFLPWYIYLPCRLPFKNVGERMGTSIIYAITEIIKYRCTLISEKATFTSRWQDPPLVTITEAGDEFEPVRSQSGMQLKLKVGESAMYLVHPGVPPALDTLMQDVDTFIETSGLPKVLQGLYTGAASGVAMSLLRNPTLMRVAFKQKSVENACIQMNSDFLRLLERKLSKPIDLWGTDKIGAQFDTVTDPKKIGKYYRNTVKLSASLPSDDANTVNMLTSMITSGMLDVTTARDVAQQVLHDLVPQSLVEESEKILASKALMDPAFVMAIAQKIAQKVNLPYLQPQDTGAGGKGGMGDKVPQMPAGTLPSQTPGFGGGNTDPNMMQRLQELSKSNPGGLQGPPRVSPGEAQVGQISTT